MSESEERDIDLIEKYHNGTLRTVENQAVKDRIASDPVFASMVEDYIDIIDGIRSSAKEKFKDTVAEWETEIRQEEQKKSRTISEVFTKYWQIAAVLLIVALVAVYFLMPRAITTHDDLYASYFVPYEDVLSVRDNSNTSLTEAMHFYNQKEYAAAADRLGRYVRSSEDPKTLSTETFYWGISLLESGQPEDAIAALTSVVNHQGLLKEQAEWYRALAYLKLGDIDSCKKQLNEINREGHDYQSKAANLLRDL